MIVLGKRSVNVLHAFSLTHKLILFLSAADGQGHSPRTVLQVVKRKPGLPTALQCRMDVLKAFYQCFQPPVPAGVYERSGNGSVANAGK